MAGHSLKWTGRQVFGNPRKHGLEDPGSTAIKPLCRALIAPVESGLAANHFCLMQEAPFPTLTQKSLFPSPIQPKEVCKQQKQNDEEMTRPSWTLGPSIFPGHILDQTAKPCAVKIALNPPNENHLSGEGAKPCFCCWSQLGQGKYLDNINSCGESKTPAYFSSLLLIIRHVLKAEPSAMGQRQSF